MASTVPTRDDGRFLDLWWRILRTGLKATSLKFALAYALLEIASEYKPTCAPLEVSKHELTQRFIRYYWLQATRYHLCQARTQRMEPSISFLLEEAAAAMDPAVQEPSQLPHAIVKRLTQDGFKEILPRFHTIPGGKPPATHQFYALSKQGIAISPQAHSFLARHAEILQPAVILEWVCWLEACNGDTPAIASKLRTALEYHRRCPSPALVQKVEQADDPFGEIVRLLSSATGSLS